MFSFALSGLAASGKALLRLPILLSLYAMGFTLLLLLGTLLALMLDGPALPLLGLTIAFAMFAVLLLFMGLIGEQIRILAERSRGVPLVIEEARINFPESRNSPAARSAVGPR